MPSGPSNSNPFRLTARFATTEIRSALPQRSPKPLIVPCTCVAPASTAASELAMASSQSLWQWIPIGTSTAESAARVSSAISFGMRAAVGVAEHDSRGPGGGGGLDRLAGVFGIVLPAVEEMLGVVDHFAARFAEIADRFVDHRQVFFERNAEHLGCMEGRSLADDRQRRGAAIEQGFHAGIVRPVERLCGGSCRSRKRGHVSSSALSRAERIGRLFRSTGDSPLR